MVHLLKKEKRVAELESATLVFRGNDCCVSPFFMSILDV